MNSLVSVEEEEVSCDGSLVLNASNISGSSIESESENKLNDTNDTSSDSIDTDKSSPDSVVVCLPDSDIVNQSCESVDISLHPNVITLEQAFASSKAEKDFRGFAVDLGCLSLPILLDNEVISLDDNIDLSKDIENLFLSDTESNDSFDGFTESSASSFEGFVQRNYDAALKNNNLNQSENLLKDSLPCEVQFDKHEHKVLISEKSRSKLKNKNSPNFQELGTPQVDLLDTTPFKRKRGRPRKFISHLHQNSSEGLNNSFHISSSKKSPKAVDGINGVRKQWQSKEKTLINSDGPKPLSQPELFLSDLDSSHSEGLQRSSSEESFEGFIDVDFDLALKVPKKNFGLQKHANKNDSLDRNLRQRSFNHAAEGETVLSKKRSKLNDSLDSIVIPSQEDLSDYIGYYCNAIGCTINWLESSEIRCQPVPINNGVVHELNEFAKKINWEPRYIAVWILRLRGYNVVNISDEDLGNIHLILRRRKALTTIFAGKQLRKSKINSFDTIEFKLPTVEKLDNEKNSCKKANSLTKSLKNIDCKPVHHELPALFENEENTVSTKPSIYNEKENKQSQDLVEKNKQNHHSKSIDLMLPDKCFSNLQIATDCSDVNTAIDNTRRKLSSNRASLQHLSIHLPNNENYPVRRRSQVQNKEYVEMKTIHPELNEAQKCNTTSNKNTRLVHSKKKGLESNSQELQLGLNKNLLNGDKIIESSSINERVDHDKITSCSKDWLISECGLLKDTESSKYDSLPILKSANIKIGSTLALRSKTTKFQSNDDTNSHSISTPASITEDTANLRNYQNKSIKFKNISPKDMNKGDSGLKRAMESRSVKPSHEDFKFIQNKYTKSVSTDNVNVSSKGRILKPTVKIQDLYSDKHLLLNSSFELESSNINNTDIAKKATYEHSLKNVKPFYCITPIQNNFSDDGNIIGKHCNESGITIKLLNSDERSPKLITNGIVYELYHFFKQRNAKLTTLVHTIYKLKDIPIDKAPVISTMAKIHELVKVTWDEQILANPNMPYNEFEMGISSSFYTTQIKQTCESGQERKKRKVEHTISMPINGHKDGNEEHIGLNEVKNSSSSKYENRIFDLNATKGQAGKITKGDIVYLYTRWLKKKMEGQFKVFVTDLSNDVENLILERKVGAMRIPVGALMSSSVKLFEKFRKLSKTNMQEAKDYLLEDWVHDIQELLNPNQSLKITVDEDSKLVSNSTPINSNLNEISNSETDFSNDAEGLNNKYKSDDSVDWMTTQSKCVLLDKSYGDANIRKHSKTEEVPMLISDENNSFEHDVGKSAKTVCENKLEIENKGKLETHEKKLVARESKVAEEYEVEKIVGYRIVKIGDKSVTEFRVRWVGFTSEEDSWVNVDDLQCPDRLTEFWDALNKQRASKNLSKTVAQENHSCIEMPDCDQQRKFQSVTDGNKNLFSNFRKMVKKPHEIFIPIVTRLKPSLIDYQYDEEGPIPKRVRVSKGEILSIFNNWCQENHENLKTGANIPVDVDVLISRVKEFMDIKKVRNFNPNCIYDVCFRMSLMKEKLQDPCKVKEYLSGDVIDLIESSRKHQEFVRVENVNKIKNYKIQAGREYQDDIERKIKSINKFEKESLLIANYIEEHGMKASFEEMLEEDILCLKKVLSLAIANHEEINSAKTMEALKNKSESTVQELKDCGLKDRTIDELIKILLKST